MKVLVTGADGFAGSWLTRRLAEDGHAVFAAVRPGGPVRPLPDGVVSVPFALERQDTVREALSGEWDAVCHLAAVSSGADALRDVAGAWLVNTVGTAVVAETLGEQRVSGGADPLLLVVSSAEVYGRGKGEPRRETDHAEPCSPYAASKLAAELAALEVWRRTGLRVVIARPFPHAGPGQDERFVVPAFVRRLKEARASGAGEVRVGNLEPVRELLYVGDVVDAYARLLLRGVAGEIYNVGSGVGLSIRELFERLSQRLGVEAAPVPDPALVRPADIPHLTGDGSKLHAATGWRPTVGVDELLDEVIGAQAN